VPSESDAAEIASRFAGEPAGQVVRFPTGLANYVYDVAFPGGRRLVVRIAAPGAGNAMAGAEYWSRTLRPLGVPLPALFEAGHHDGCAYLVLERLPGADLGLVYASLSAEQKRSIAAGVADIQRDKMGCLCEGKGFGYAAHQDGPFRHRTWADVLRSSLRRGRRRILSAGVFDPDLVSEVERALERRAASLASVRPQPFLDDATTKNVIVSEGRLSGIVDVDCICYGDPLLTVGLTRTALRNQAESTDYVDFWCEHLGLGDEQRAAVSLYAAVFCVDFMSEVGQRFNRSEAIEVDAGGAERLERMLSQELEGL
jgi:aminoglycoside phosphotransferase